MRKIAAFALVGLVSSTSIAQETAETAAIADAPAATEVAEPVESTEASRVAQSPISLGARINGTGFEVDMSYNSSEVYKIGVVVGRVTDEEKTEGGDLNAWQYVEERKAVIGSFLLAQGEARLWSSESGRHSLRGLASIGAMGAKFEYSRNRYKPYNGAFCPIGPCTKSLEEGHDAGDAANLAIVRTGVTYAYIVRRDNRGWLYSFEAGMNGISVLKKEERTLTSAPYSETLSSDRIARPFLHAGLNVRF